MATEKAIEARRAAEWQALYERLEAIEKRLAEVDKTLKGLTGGQNAKPKK